MKKAIEVYRAQTAQVCDKVLFWCFNGSFIASGSEDSKVLHSFLAYCIKSSQHLPTHVNESSSLSLRDLMIYCFKRFA